MNSRYTAMAEVREGIAADGRREHQLREVIRNDAPGWISRTQVIV